MALPQSISYDAPPAHDLPTRRAAWPLHRDRSALLIHDMQHYFVRPYDPQCPALRGAIQAIADLAADARALDIPVVYTAQPGSQSPDSRGLLTSLWGPGLTDAEADTAILPELAPAPGETVLVKHRYSAFARSPLQDWLAKRGRDQLVITGIYAHIGVTATALDAFMRDIQTFVVADAVADFSQQHHRRALEHVAAISSTVLDAAEARAAWGAPASDSWLSAQLAELVDAEFAASAEAAPEEDLFALGLDSLRTFALLDRFADRGVAIEFGDFVLSPTLGFLSRALASAPTR